MRLFKIFSPKITAKVGSAIAEAPQKVITLIELNQQQISALRNLILSRKTPEAVEEFSKAIPQQLKTLSHIENGSENGLLDFVLESKDTKLAEKFIKKLKTVPGLFEELLFKTNKIGNPKIQSMHGEDIDMFKLLNTEITDDLTRYKLFANLIEPVHSDVIVGEIEKIMRTSKETTNLPAVQKARMHVEQLLRNYASSRAFTY